MVRGGNGIAASDRVRRWAGVAGLLLCGALGLALVVLVGGATGPAALLLGLTLATLPTPVYVALILWIDRFEAEPPALLGLAFFLGATLAAFAAALANTAVSRWAADDPALTTSVVVSGAVIEELAKGIVLIGLLARRRDECDGPIDGIVYAGMVGLGFATVENVQYYGLAAAAGGVPGGLFMLRGVLAPFAHPLFTAATGAALGLALHARRGPWRALLPALGLTAAAGLHALWNLSAQRGALVATYVSVMVPVFCAGLLAIALELRREGRAIAEHLRPELLSGVLTADTLAGLASVRGRLAMRWQALRREGRAGWRRVGLLHQTSGELAWLRRRMRDATLIDDDTRTREAAHLAEIIRLTRRV